jgi:predicted phosphoribosyltransferase
MFEDRRDAGRKLTRALEAYRGRDVLVLAIPRGGIEVGYQVALALDAEFSLLVIRKLPYPNNPEAGFGAVAEDGSRFIIQEAVRWLSDETIEQVIERQKREVERRIEVLRKGRSLPDINGRTVILVDDGIAMGSTMRAAIQLCKDKGAGRIVVAVPVAGQQVAEDIEQRVDELIVLEQPQFFRAVAQVYHHWYDVPDSEVLALMDRWRRRREKTG